jgi:hypothetical protein
MSGSAISVAVVIIVLGACVALWMRNPKKGE